MEGVVEGHKFLLETSVRHPPVRYPVMIQQAQRKKRVEWRAETMQSTSPRLKFPNVDTGLSNVDYNVSSAVLTGP